MINMAKTAGHEIVPALEREAQRRREQACSEVERLESKIARLEGIKARRRFAPLVSFRIHIARVQLGRAKDQCAANLEG